jgi:hypothetical protein
MGGALSCVLNQFSLVDIRQRLTNIRGKRMGIGIVLLGQSPNDLGY